MDTSLSLYVHIPFCRQKCSYCDFPAYERMEEYMETYMAALEMELELYAKTWSKVPLDTIYFGGGTPTHVPISLLAHLIEKINSSFSTTHCREWTIESNPGELSLSELKNLRALGFTRISFGVQTLNNNLLSFLRRTHTGEEALRAINEAAQAGFQHINADLIYGLPGQTMQDIRDTVTLLAMPVLDHLSIYGLQLERGSYLYALSKKGELVLPDDQEREAMYDYLIAQCESAGFSRYEISNFARNKAYGLHNLRYWKGLPYIGIGAGAHGYLDQTRYGNTPYVVPYFRKIECYEWPRQDSETITKEREAEDFCFLNLRTKWGLSLALYEERFKRSVMDDFGPIISKLKEQGLIHREGDFLRLTRQGTKYGNYVFSQFVDVL